MRDIGERFIVGSATSAGAVGITLSNMNEWVRLAGGLAFIAVSTLTIISWVQKILRDRKSENRYDRDAARYDRREAQHDRQDAKLDREAARGDRQDAKDALP